MKIIKQPPSPEVMATAPTPTAEPPATPPQPPETKSLSVDDVMRDWKDLQQLEKAKKDIESKIQVIKDRIGPAYKELGAMLGIDQEPTTASRKPRAKAAKTARGTKAGKGGGGGGGTQVDTAEEVVKGLGKDFVLAEFLDGLEQKGLGDANANYLLQQLKKKSVIKSTARGKFKKT